MRTISDKSVPTDHEGGNGNHDQAGASGHLTPAYSPNVTLIGFDSMTLRTREGNDSVAEAASLSAADLESLRGAFRGSMEQFRSASEQNGEVLLDHLKAYTEPSVPQLDVSSLSTVDTQAATIPGLPQAPTTEEDRLEASGLSRVLSLLLLAGLIGGVSYIGYAAVRAFSDAWVAPINLSPDSDQVIKLNVDMNKRTADMKGLEMEQRRIDRDLKHAETALESLRDLRNDLRGSLQSERTLFQHESRTSAAVASKLRQQRAVLADLHLSQASRVAEAKEQLAAGLISRTDYDNQVRELKRLKGQLLGLQRQIRTAQLDKARSSSEAAAWDRVAQRDSKRADSPQLPSTVRATPRVVQLRERLIQIEMQLHELEDRTRSLTEGSELNAQTLEKARKVLTRIKQRPLYRAIKASTDVAFVPYSELKDVKEKDDVYACTWLIFNCRHVGRIAEVLKGEVVAQDPGGEPARGRYAILALADKEAVRESALRVRPTTTSSKSSR